MKTFKNYIAIAATMMLSCTGFSAQAAQGTTHDHPLSDTQTKEYLKNYLGITNYSGSNWGYTKSYSGTVAPTATSTGDVIFVEVNDYWKGSNWQNTPSLYNQVKYGVKAIHKVSQSATIGSGTLYNYLATTNRFFFAIRTSDMYDGFVGKNAWNSYSTGKYYLNESYKMPFRWYNEFSSCSDTDGDGWDHLTAAYDALKDGDFQKVPHSCSNSLEKNHFTTLYDKTTVNQTYTASAMLYIPSGANPTVNNKNGEYSGSNIPKVFFYINKLAGERVTKTKATSSQCKYAALLNWETSIDKARKNDANFLTWNSKVGGVKEESYVYRKIEGEDEFTDVWVGDNGLVDTKTWTDNTLPRPRTESGYDVTYYIITNAVTYNAKGERLGEEIGSAVTNQVTIHIPGSEQTFDLTIANKFNSTFTPSSNNIHKSYNLISNTISGKVNELTPAISTLAAGDEFKLIRIEETGNTTINLLKITKVSTSYYGGTTYTYTLNNGAAKTAKWTSMQDVLNIAAGYTDKVNSVPGRQYDARYQLIYTHNGSDLNSNTVTAQGKRTDVQVIKDYRSGTPDPEKNAAEELYTVDVRFKPIMSDDIAHYHIWRNAEEKVVRIGQSGTKFNIVGKDEDGNFNVDLGTATPDDEGYITVHVDGSLKKHVCDFEDGCGHALNPNDLFFTVEVCTTGGNTYGNYDRASDFQGDRSELVLNSYGSFYTGDETLPDAYVAEISWDKIKNEDNLDADDYVSREPDYYTVHRYRVSAGGEVTFEPITQFWRGHNDIFDADGKLIEKGNYHLVDQTKDGSAYKFTPALIDQVLRETGDPLFYVVDMFRDHEFVADGTNIFPCIYYVKAHFESPFAIPSPMALTDGGDDVDVFDAIVPELRNYVEKNSNPCRATSIIVTGVKDVKKADVVATTYYTLQGIKVNNPAPGEIVVARYQMSNGTTQGRVVKF